MMVKPHAELAPRSQRCPWADTSDLVTNCSEPIHFAFLSSAWQHTYWWPHQLHLNILTAKTLVLSCDQLPYMPFKVSAGVSPCVLKNLFVLIRCDMVISAKCSNIWSLHFLVRSRPDPAQESLCCHRDSSPLPVWCRKLPGLLAKLSLAKPLEK